MQKFLEKQKILFKEISNSSGVLLNKKKESMFISFLGFLKEKNKTINLISRNTTDEVLINKHLLSSLIFVETITGIKSSIVNNSIVDVGTGGGFPGIICAICFPEYQVFLIESIRKKADFLREVAVKSELNNVYVVNDRAEKIACNKKYHEQFDIVTARAVASMSDSLNLCMPLVRKGGFFLTIKSESQQQEIKKSYNLVQKMGASISCENKAKNIMVLVRKS